MTPRVIMPEGTAVWLIDNTTLTFEQIADFCGFHVLQIQGIADGDVAVGIRAFDPIENHQLDRDEVHKGERDPNYRMALKESPVPASKSKRRQKKYTPISRRQDRPAAIAWLVKYHPEIHHRQIIKLVGTTRETIEKIRNRTHWNIASIQPTDPVALGICTQIDLDNAVRVAAERKKAEKAAESAQPGKSLMDTNQSLKQKPESRIPASISGLETFTLGTTDTAGTPKEE